MIILELMVGAENFQPLRGYSFVSVGKKNFCIYFVSVSASVRYLLSPVAFVLIPHGSGRVRAMG